MTKQNLILDFDGVVCNSIESFCRVYSYYFKTHFLYKVPNPDSVNKYDLSDECPLVPKHKIWSFFEHDLFFKELNFFPNAKEVIHRLNDKFNIIICTIGTHKNASKKLMWIEKNLPFINDFIVLNNKNSLGKDIVNMKNSIFIDDNENNLFSSNATTKYCFGKTYSWNENWDGKRLIDWLEVEKKL